MDNTSISQDKFGVYPADGEYSIFVAGEFITYAQTQERALEIYHEALRLWSKNARQVTK